MDTGHSDSEEEAMRSLLGARVSNEDQAAVQRHWDPTGRRRLPALTTMEVINLVLASRDDVTIATSNERTALLESYVKGSERDGYAQSGLRRAMASLMSWSGKKTLDMQMETVLESSRLTCIPLSA